VNFFYFAVGMPRRFGGASGATFYLMSTVDAQSKSLDGAKSYGLNVPASIPVKDFWSVILYSTRTRSFLGTEKFGLSSKDKLQVNAEAGRF
jgi:hypothetical protein